LIAASGLVQHISFDRFAAGTMERTGPTVGATAVRQQLGYDGSGVGVAVIDSGISAWHDDLTAAGGTAQRVDAFVDFVNHAGASYDDFGHGTHVAGIVAGNGFDSGGARSGIAPGVHLVVLKALDGAGHGRISDIIAALGYVVAHRMQFNIRVVNLSIGAGVYESYNTDPLTLAARAVVSSGVVVVAAAGNYGRDAQGNPVYGGTTAPGNAPWVVTVGASSHMGTVDRADDTMAAFSSRGPSAVDYGAKPDLVAPGVGIESLSDPSSALYASDGPYLLSGTVATPYLPYLSLSGTSMATPVVSGTVALMLQANPALTPNAVKAILQYTSQVYGGYDPLTEGAGFLNALGAVELAAFMAAPSQTSYPASAIWSTRLIWGNQLVHGGVLTPDASAWPVTVTWGAPTTATGQLVAWGVICGSGDCSGGGGNWSPWRLDGNAQNVVWGSSCGNGDCPGAWSVVGPSTATWGQDDSDTVVWGTNSDSDTVVWGTTCSDPSCQPVVWSHQ
jgi:serine protease AprX